MREQVLHYIRERKLLKAGDRVAVAVSGGADSVALLRVLLELRNELGIVLHVAHFNHQLRGKESDADESFVGDLARRHDLSFFAGRGDVRVQAELNKRSLEQEARLLRYNWLIDLADEERLDAIATAHNADDQAETVLMKFLRGAGTRGLAGIHPELIRDRTRIVRPLLEITRAEVERYLASLHQPWCEDHSNSDTRMTRNRIRHELLPLLERDYNPDLRRTLRTTADLAAEEEKYWEQWTTAYLRDNLVDDHTLAVIRFQRQLVGGVAAESVALQRRVVKSFLERHGIAGDFDHIEALRRCIHRGPPVVNLPGGWIARRDRLALSLVPPVSQDGSAPGAFQATLRCPGQLRIPEAGLSLRAQLLSTHDAFFEPPGSLLDFARIGGSLTLRNWHPGDRFRPAHSASEEKLKRLFSEKRIPAEQRPLWPVALNKDDQIVWVRGFPVAHDFAWIPGSGDALRIEAVPSEPPSGTSLPQTESK